MNERSAPARPPRALPIDPAPLSLESVSATARAAVRELGWGLRLVRSDQARRLERAARIRDPTRRDDALTALAAKRSVTNGAAFFWVLPRRRSVELHRLLLTFQTLANFLDLLSEREARETGEAPWGWTPAIADAVSPGGVHRRRSGFGDDGYVDELVDACRRGCSALPSFEALRPVVDRESRMAETLDVEHDPAKESRWRRLQWFARTQLRGDDSLTWFESTAGASSLLTVIAPMALAADPGVTSAELEAAADAYRRVATLSALLDNYIDRFEDASTGANNYLNLYASSQDAAARISVLIEQSLSGVASLPRGERHLVVVAAMIAMFLTSRSLTQGQAAKETRTLIASGGGLTRALVAPLLAWRMLHRRPSG